MHSVEKTKFELKKLQETWSWSNSDLKLGAIGVPEDLITKILKDGKYSPFIPNKNNKAENDCLKQAGRI